MELGVLGPLQVRQDGTPVAIPGAKPRAILTMLGLHGGSVVPADTLVELLWGEEPPRTAAKALQTHISSLRRALGDGFVLTQGAGWVLADSEIDASRYKSAARLGRDAAAAGDTSQAVARFEEALALWRGTPELPDGRPGTSEKTRWVESHAALVEDRADALLATGRAAEVIGDLEAAVAEAPLRERRWGQLMLALYRAGRQGEALGAYQRARSLLADELGVDPGPNLRRLEAAIVAQDASLDVAVAQHAPSVTRAVTFLLTDIEGSTAAWEADADAMAVALARHDELVEQVVTSRGGRLIKTRGEGDATFSVFDRPSAAASAAVELQDAIAHEPWASPDPIRVRMALHTGEVELRDGDYFGRAVNRVARLRSLAEGGQILCSGATAELVIDTLADDVLLTDLGMRQLKNLARPEHVFELRMENGVAQPESHTVEAAPLERPDLPAVLVGPGPFVGRGRELEGLLSAWQTALAGGVRTVLVAGEPGVGKTRLAGEWSQRAYELGAIVLYGRCDEDLGAPYQPFAEALRSLVPCMGPDRLRGLRGVEALLSIVPGLADVVPDLVRPAHSDPDTERYALFDAVVALLETASTSAPVLLVLDDLHWAAKPTLLLLRHLLRFGDHARVQIVGTYRSTDLDRAHPLAATLADLHRDGTANRLSLGGLDEDDVTAYVAEVGYDDEELAHALASVTGGNPFFLIEALRHVDESGGVWDQSTLPQGVREAVSRRLSRLPIETNKALAAAAVIGSRFALELVEQVVGTDLVDAFDEARQAGIVIEEPGGFYRFNHAIVRQSLLAELASVRRMRLHQRIATTLEASPGADDELLAELAHHYFECAWAGNAAKAVFYCRRAADQAMARLAYEGAADLYHRALHALEEIDDELPDRDDQTVELLVARCEALLAAGDVASAAGAISQLQAATVDSARLAAWATCFDGQLTMLIHPERLDEVEIALGAAAAKLAELDDSAGEAKAHTVRAGCLARLGRIGDCEVALDDALTAARRAREHRRVNAVLAGAPLAALWGPNPVPRAGGRCLDVVRLLRITTDSPAVEATSTRCQAVLEAFRGRTAAARRMIDSARRTVTELGLRHALLEVEQFAGIVELIGNDPAAAEAHLRKAYNGFRRMGLDADTAETAALLGRACLALDRETEAAELCTESERLAGHALKASIAWRTLRAHLLARGNDYDAAHQVAEAAVTLAERTDALVDHGDACLTLATVLGRGGDMAAARTAAQQAVDLYERKGAAALADMARAVLGESAVPPAPASPEAPVVELDNACVRAIRELDAAIDREAWDETERCLAPEITLESRRGIVGFPRVIVSPRQWINDVVRSTRNLGGVWHGHQIIAVRGEGLALTGLRVHTGDASPGAPRDDSLQLFGLDQEGQIALHVWFDIDDMDAAIAELEAVDARLEAEHPKARRLENAATRVYERFWSFFAARDWDRAAAVVSVDLSGADLRRVVNAGDRGSRETVIEDLRVAADLGFAIWMADVVATRGDRLALTRVRASGHDPETIQNDAFNIVEINADDEITAIVVLDLDDIDAAFGELDRRYLAGEAAPYSNTWSAILQAFAAFNAHQLPSATPDWLTIDHRRGRGFSPGDLVPYIRAAWELAPQAKIYVEAVHRLSSLGAVVTEVLPGTSPNGFDAEWLEVNLLTVQGDLIDRSELFDEADLDAAIARFDQLGRPALRPGNTASQVAERFLAHFTAHDWDALAEMLAENFSTEDRRRVVGAEARHGRDAEIASMRVVADLGGTNMTSTVVATRGTRLILTRLSYADWDQEPGAFHTDVLDVIEIDSDERLLARIVFDLDDFDAAITELDARYLAGEAAVHACTWSAVASSYAALNRQEPPRTSPDCVNVDHRRETAFGPGDVSAYINAGWDSQQNSNIYVEQVHRLSDAGAVITYAAQEFSEEGLRAEWRGIAVFAVADGVIHRTEVFDDTDFRAAITRFEELGQPTPGLENAASRVFKHVWSHFAAGDWNAMAEKVADDYVGIDHRRVVAAETQHGRDAVIRDLQAAAEVGFTISMVSAIAIRGERLVLARSRAAGRDPGAVQNDALNVVAVDAGDRIARVVSYDLEDFDAAIAELEARYVAGEAMAYARTWSVITGAYAALNRREHPATTADWVNIDHRRGISLAPGHVSALLNNWLVTPDLSNSIEAVHRLDDLGAVVTNVTHETSREGFEAEWRGISILTIEGDLVNRLEIFDESDLDAAIARFEELHSSARQLQNKASQISDRYLAYFAAHDWDSMAEMTAEDFSSDDRRRVVGAGVQSTREVDIENMRAWADVGIKKMVSDVIAIRGERLFLGRTRFFGPEQGPAAFHSEVLGLVEIDAENRVVARVVFDADDFDAAVAELDSRYLAGEAAPHARTWSLMAEAFAALNRREMPATTPNWVNTDHRRLAPIGAGDLGAFLHATWELSPRARIYIAAVHRLSDCGAVVSHVAIGTSPEGFDAEWHVVDVVRFDGDRISRTELFDESDLADALACFEAIQAPGRPENAASRLYERFKACYASRDMRAIADMFADNVCTEDRRRVVNAGIRPGKSAVMDEVSALAELGIDLMTEVIATRGARLVLSRVQISGADPGHDGFSVVGLDIIELDAGGQAVARLVFDLDDIEAAFNELDARYVAGEAAAHADVWSAIAGVHEMFNRHEYPPEDWVTVDRRQGTPFSASDMTSAVHTLFDLTPDFKVHIEAVHEINSRGAVITNYAHGSSPDGVGVEWRMVMLLLVEEGRLTRCEVFDETDPGAAIARLKELSRPASRLENAATRSVELFLAQFAARNWDAMAELIDEEFCSDDRRRGINAGIRRGRDVEMANWRATAEVWKSDVRATTVATRGERLAILRFTFASQDSLPAASQAAAISVVHVNDDNRCAATVVFDAEDFVSAFAELENRYLAGEAAAHAHPWSVVSGAYTAMNRHELFPTTPDFVDIDHRHVTTIASGDAIANLRASWELAPNLNIYIEAVHRLNHLGAAITYAAKGTSQDGFEGEWRAINILTIEGDLIRRAEIFDEADLDAALARFDELSRPVLKNAASQAYERICEHLDARDWDALAELTAENISVDDRRRVVNAGVISGRKANIESSRALAEVGFTLKMLNVIATRGARLALIRVRVSGSDPEAVANDALIVVEVDSARRVAADVIFDLEDIDAAFAELESRYLAGEAANHADTWSVVIGANTQFNRHELPATTPDPVYIDHRPLVSIDDVDLARSVGAMWDLTSETSAYIEAVHQLSELGAVTTQVLRMRSREGFDAELRLTYVIAVERDLLSRIEVFDEADLDKALTRFKELHQPTQRLENAASRAERLLFTRSAARDWAAAAEILADNSFVEDRRRVVNVGFWGGRDVVLENMRALEEGLARVTLTVIATRGERLALIRVRSFDHGLEPEGFVIEMLGIAEIDSAGRIAAHVFFDVHDIDRAFEELETRYLAVETAAHRRTWSTLLRAFAGFNEHKLPLTTPDWVNLDHRRGRAFSPGDLVPYIHATWQVAPQAKIYVYAVHRLSDLGAVVTQSTHGTSPDGFDAEWLEITLLTLDGDLINRIEVFDEADLDAAITRFDELTGKDQPK
ncbi:regulator [Mycobacterium colombiense]|uniref:Regulator n=1 Tax=Mycobacterium colombiense TaxID=339268 RepID=A0A329KCT2_9MYCO|nr:BTAD domain-containing putative transcriptional regulator [Mycobacterium colombiense]RAU92899.1 regulator [Mycobacterium colombiense]